MLVLSIAVTLSARVLLVALFLPFSALDKVLNFKQAIDQAVEAIPDRSLVNRVILSFGLLPFDIRYVACYIDGNCRSARCVCSRGVLHRHCFALEAVLEGEGLPVARCQPWPGDVLGFPQKPGTRRRLSGSRVRRDVDRIDFPSWPIRWHLRTPTPKAATRARDARATEDTLLALVDRR